MKGQGKDAGFGPYRQSERKEIYKKYIDILIKKGKAYYAFDTTEDLAKERKPREKGNLYLQLAQQNKRKVYKLFGFI